MTVNPTKEYIFIQDDLQYHVTAGFLGFVCAIILPNSVNDLARKVGDLITSAIGSEGINSGAWLPKIWMISLSLTFGDKLDALVNKSMSTSGPICSTSHRNFRTLATV